MATDDLDNSASGPISSLCNSGSLWFPVRTRFEGEGDFRIDTDGRPVPLVAGDTTNSYQLFSVPYELDNGQVMQVLADDLGPYDNTMWRFFDYNADNPVATRFLEGEAARPFVPGRSYFIITRQEDIVVDGGPGQTRNPVCTDSIQVYEGWNLIATPFNFPLHKKSLSFNNSNSIVTLRSYEAGWNITDVMEPLKGYALFVSSENSNDDIYLVFLPVAAPGRASKVTAELGFEPGDFGPGSETLHSQLMSQIREFLLAGRRLHIHINSPWDNVPIRPMPRQSDILGTAAYSTGDAGEMGIGSGYWSLH